MRQVASRGITSTQKREEKPGASTHNKVAIAASSLVRSFTHSASGCRRPRTREKLSRLPKLDGFEGRAAGALAECRNHESNNDK